MSCSTPGRFGTNTERLEDMALVEFQTGLGQLLRDQQSSDPLHGVKLDANEKRYFETLRETAGFRFCASIQRSWCISRAAKGAYFTLSLLPHVKRDALLNEWVDMGAGTQSFYDAEGESFLSFISERLTDPSHELSMCRFEQATLRANNGATRYTAPDPAKLASPDCVLRRGSYAGLVSFHVDLELLMHAAQNHEPLPPLSDDPLVLIFSPGLPQLWYTPPPEDLEVWNALESPASVKTLLSRNLTPETIATLLRQGTAEYA
ncbi:MAG TPA: hypothetical protein VLL54_04735 [Pyrinomonadaceae bacterium]|nr:hypothetical protein [Pyrinomonadaceae bacterium]